MLHSIFFILQKIQFIYFGCLTKWENDQYICRFKKCKPKKQLFQIFFFRFILHKLLKGVVPKISNYVHIFITRKRKKKKQFYSFSLFSWMRNFLDWFCSSVLLNSFGFNFNFWFFRIQIRLWKLLFQFMLKSWLFFAY